MRRLNTEESIQLLVNEHDYIRRMKLHPGVSQEWVDRILRITARMIDEIEVPDRVKVHVMTAPCGYVGNPDVEFDATDSDWRSMAASTHRLPLGSNDDDELATRFAREISDRIQWHDVEWFCPYVILLDMGHVPSINVNGYATRYAILNVENQDG
jgi:hypothetical protein